MQKIGKRFLIRGRVQGVFYRRFAHQEATSLGLTGWARNLADGGVEIEAFGEDSAFVPYLEKLRHGPIAAHVDNIREEVIPWQEHFAFKVVE